MKKLTLLLVLLVLLLSGCASGAETDALPPVTVEQTGVIAEGRLLPAENIELFFSARGKVAEILVEEGDSVKAGDVLARLADSAQAEAGLAAAQLELTAAQQAYDTLLRTADPARAQALQAYINAQTTRAEAERAWEDLDRDTLDDDIDDAQAKVNDKKDLLKDAQDEFDKYKDLSEDNTTRKKAKDDLDTAQDNYNEAIRELEALQNKEGNLRAALDAAIGAEAEAKRTYDNMTNGPDADQLALLEARLSNAKAQFAAAELALDNYIIKAPFDGQVADVNTKLGELIGPEKPAITLADFSAWNVETTDLTELDVVDVYVGQIVTIAVDALPGEEMTGTVESISQTYGTRAGDIIYTVTIAVENIPAAARWGMTVEVNFQP